MIHITPIAIRCKINTGQFTCDFTTTGSNQPGPAGPEVSR
jgi:hypothetical protein